MEGTQAMTGLPHIPFVNGARAIGGAGKALALKDEAERLASPTRISPAGNMVPKGKESALFGRRQARRINAEAGRGLEDARVEGGLGVGSVAFENIVEPGEVIPEEASFS